MPCSSGQASNSQWGYTLSWVKTPTSSFPASTEAFIKYLAYKNWYFLTFGTLLPRAKKKKAQMATMPWVFQASLFLTTALKSSTCVCPSDEPFFLLFIYESEITSQANRPLFHSCSFTFLFLEGLASTAKMWTNNARVLSNCCNGLPLRAWPPAAAQRQATWQCGSNFTRQD